MQYTEKELSQLIQEVEKEFTAHLAKSEDTSLAKSEDGEKDHKEEEKEEPKHEAKESEGHEEHKEEEKEEHKPEHEEEHKEGHDDHGYDEEDMAHMEKMYRSMSKGELSAHHDCIKKITGKGEAEMEKSEKPKDMGDADHKSGGEMSSCEPAKTPGAKSPASKAEGMQMEKSENSESDLLKSELAAEKAAKEELQKNFDAVKEFLTVFVKKSVPQAKAVTSLDVIAKSEGAVEEKPLSKGQIHEILKAKTADPSLKKSDRDAITSYYLTNQVDVNRISHLLK